MGKIVFLCLMCRLTLYHFPNGSISSASPNRVREYSRKAFQVFHAGFGGFGCSGHDKTESHCKVPSRNCGSMAFPLYLVMSLNRSAFVYMRHLLTCISCFVVIWGGIRSIINASSALCSLILGSFGMIISMLHWLENSHIFWSQVFEVRYCGHFPWRIGGFRPCF